jgi:hypothetical protein
MYRRISAVTLSATLLISALAATLVLSETAEGTPPSPTPATDLDYRIEDGHAVIRGCGGHDCRDGLIIPSTIETGSGTFPVSHIADYAFEYPDDDDEEDGEPELIIVGDVIIPDSVTSIGKGAFADQKFITQVTVGNGVQTIGDEAFDNARALTSLTLGTSVTTIGADAFYDAALATVTIPDSVTSIGDAAFRSNSITSLTLGSGLQTTGNYAFANNSIGHLVLPDAPTTLGQYSFTNSNITAIDFGASITSIGFSAFSSNQLTSVTLPASVVSIADRAFAYNPTLTEFLLEGPTPSGTAQVFTSSPNLTEVVYRPVHTYPATWAGLPTRAVARPPGPPTEVTATPGDTTATVTWSAPATSDATVTAYTITSTPHERTCLWSTGPLTCEITGLTNGTAYTFHAVATSVAGNSTSSSASTPVVPAARVIAPPPPPPPVETVPATTTPAATTRSDPPPNLIPTINTIRLLPPLNSSPPITATPRQQVSLAGTGFTPEETVHLVIASTPQILASGTADGTGAVSLTGIAPADLAPGQHTLALYAPESGHGWRQAALVEATLPATGDAGAVAPWSLLALTTGALFWLTGRGRSRGRCDDHIDPNSEHALEAINR